MSTFLWCLAGVVLNYAIGVFVLTGVLDKEGARWQDWVNDCPIPGGFFVIISAWPVLLYLAWSDSDAVQAMTPSERRYDLIASVIGATVILCAVLAVVGFVVFVILAVVNAYRLDQACVDAGGVPTRYACINPNAIIRP